jgi:hypothetical protein
MKKIILAVIISIIGITASAKTGNSKMDGYTVGDVYESQYSIHGGKITNYCVGADTKHIVKWFTKTYHPSTIKDDNWYYKMCDLQVLTALEMRVDPAIYFEILDICAKTDIGIATIIFYNFEKFMEE